MWTEPLTPVVRDFDEHMYGVAVLTGEGTVCAHVRVAYSLEISTGCFGAIVIDDASGAPRQRLRAMVLLVREALRHAQQTLGLQHASTEAPRRLQPFAAKMFGIDGDDVTAGRGDAIAFRRQLADVRTHVLSVSDADGNDAPAAESR